MFERIEKQRIAAGIELGALCDRAGVHQTTYSRRKSGRGGMREETLQRLQAALKELIDERMKVLSAMEERA